MNRLFIFPASAAGDANKYIHILVTTAGVCAVTDDAGTTVHKFTVAFTYNSSGNSKRKKIAGSYRNSPFP